MRYVLASITLAISVVSGAPATAQSALTAEEFNAYTQGKTLFYAADGQRYGAETYLRNNRVRWSFLDGECQNGRWYQQQEQICFVYDNSANPSCWTFYLENNGLSARFDSPDQENVLYEIQGSDDELICLGPEVGA